MYIEFLCCNIFLRYRLESLQLGFAIFFFGGGGAFPFSNAFDLFYSQCKKQHANIHLKYSNIKLCQSTTTKKVNFPSFVEKVKKSLDFLFSS